MNKISQYIFLMRPHQYVKNLFVFLPVFFAAKISDINILSSAFYAFISFSIISSAVYILNDYRDIEDDKKHPKKKLRPLASGVISKRNAFLLMFLLLGIGFTLILQVSLNAFYVMILYLIMNISYSIHLKHVPIVDITIISLGFVMRLFVGSFSTDIELSKWIVLMTFLLALFMALAKRRDDVLIYISTGKKMRKVLYGYNLQFLDSAMMIMASVVIVSYTIYTTSIEVVTRIGNDNLYLTSFFVILGILRYLKIALVNENTGSPTRIILTDKFIQITLIFWLIAFGAMIY